MNKFQFCTVFLSILLLGPISFGSDIFAQQPDNPGQEKKNENTPEKNNSFDRQAAFDKLSEKAKKDGKVNVLVRLDVDFTPEGFLKQAEKANQRQNIRNAQDEVVRDMPFSENNRFHKFKYVPGMAMSINQNALEHLANSPMVESIHEQTMEYPTLYTSTGIMDIDPESYDLGFTGGSGQTIAIADTGVKSLHPFFSGRIVDEACFTDNGASATQNGDCPNGKGNQTGTGAGEPCSKNGCYHGTHVAGIAAGDGASITSEPQAPDSGVAKGANIMAIQVFSNSGSSVGSWPADQIRAMEHVLDKHNDPSFTHKIAAINFSLGSTATFSSTCDGEGGGLRYDAINNLKSVGIATVIAAGNGSDPDGVSTPGCISLAITVGSTTDADGISSFSNNHDMVDVLAIGSSITSSVPTSANADCPPFQFASHLIINPPFCVLSGTSMSAPHVTGAVAILKEKDPDATVDELETALESTGVLINDGRPGATAGSKPRIDVDGALASLNTFCGRPMSSFNVIYGTAASEMIGGTPGDDLIFAGDGDDHIQAIDGDDCILVKVAMM